MSNFITKLFGRKQPVLPVEVDTVPPCSCTVPGFCPRMQFAMHGRLWEKCQTDSKFREGFSALAKPVIFDQQAHRASLPACIHRGECLRLETGKAKTKECKGCNAKKPQAPPVQWKVFACNSTERGNPECILPDCTTCPHYAHPSADDLPDVSDPFTGPVTRHLAYHLCPIAGNGVWQRNALHLRRRWHLFNGQKRISIATGEVSDRDGKPARLDTPAVVRQAFDGLDAEFIEVVNEFPRGEGVSFAPLMKPLVTKDVNSITFYAHAKGVGRSASNVTIGQWVALMYAGCLDYMPLVQNQLQRFPITGCFRLPGKHWFYSGAFFWVRNYHLLMRDWRKVGGHWGCVETWPREQFIEKQAGCLFWDKHANLYDHETMAVVRREFAEWSKANVKYRNTKEAVTCQ